jgi:tetratricopeptide (TPR) repeat protein
MAGTSEDIAMSYYRAALAAAQTGDLATANRLANYSVALGENAPNAERLREIIAVAVIGLRDIGDADARSKLRSLVSAGHYKKALRVRLPNTAAAHNARGLLFAALGRRRSSRREFKLALSLCPSNELACRALAACLRHARAKRLGVGDSPR